jgi:hypothetical protein
MGIISHRGAITAELRKFETITLPKIGAPQFVIFLDEIVNNESGGVR